MWKGNCPSQNKKAGCGGAARASPPLHGGLMYACACPYISEFPYYCHLYPAHCNRYVPQSPTEHHPFSLVEPTNSTWCIHPKEGQLMAGHTVPFLGPLKRLPATHTPHTCHKHASHACIQAHRHPSMQTHTYPHLHAHTYTPIHTGTPHKHPPM